MLLALASVLVIALLVACGATPNIAPASATATAQAQASDTAVAAFLATANAQATGTATVVNGQATATAGAFAALLSQARVIYHTPVPGPGCDHSGAAWNAFPGSHVACQGGRLKLTGSSNQLALSSVIGAIPGGFPARYIYAVDVDALQGTSAAQIGTLSGPYTMNLSAAAYNVFDAGNQDIVAGPAPSTATVHVMIIVTGQEVIYAINGAEVGSYRGQPSAVQGYQLAVYSTSSSTSVEADFSNFTISELP